jgi:hypothetical protein
VQTAAGAVVFSTEERRGPAGFLEARFPAEAGVGEGWQESEQVNPGSASPTKPPPTKRRKSREGGRQKKKSKKEKKKRKDKDRSRRRTRRRSRSEEEGEAEEEEEDEARQKKKKDKRGKKAKGAKLAKDKKAGTKEKKAKVKEKKGKKRKSVCEAAPPAWGSGEEGGEPEAPAEAVLGPPCQQTVACPGEEAGVGSEAEACPAAAEGSPGQGAQCLIAASGAGPAAQQAYLYVGPADPDDVDLAYALGPGWAWSHVPAREVAQCRLPGGGGEPGGSRVYRNRQFAWKACGGPGGAGEAAAAFCWRMNGGQGPEPTA